MNIDEAFAKWYASQDNAGLPWQTSREELFNVFYAGWHAHVEALKQTDLFPGTWHKDGLLAPAAPDAQAIRDTKDLKAYFGSLKLEQHPLPTAEDIYAAYPRKVGKGAAIKAIKKVMKFVDAAWLLIRVQAYAAAVAKWPVADKQFIPHPATWFNQERYLDDPKEWERGAAASQFGKTH